MDFEPEFPKITNTRYKCAACYKQYKKKEHLVEHINVSFHSVHQPRCGVCKKHFKSFESQREHVTGPVAKENCKRVFSEQGCDLCLKIFDCPNSLSAHKYMCRLSAPVPLVTMMERCEEFKHDINSSNEYHVGDGTEAIALDCEMVAVGSDGSLDLCARVCLIDEDETILFHTYVQPQYPVVNYRYEVTGLTEEHLRDGMPLQKVQDKVLQILYNGKTKLLVGHSLENDLDCLRINYPDYLLRDTANYHPLMKTNLVSHPLKYLTRTYLGYDIQSGFHDPYEDCVSAMRLYKRFCALDHQKEGNVASLAMLCAKDIPGSFDSWETDKLEKMTLDELYEMSRFLGIWCKNSSVSSAATVTWVANQHNPINGSSGLLMINSSGNVVLLSQNSTVVWSIALSKQPRNPILQLLDSGNLVLREARDGNSRNYLWQSLQWDEKAGLYRSLLASSSSDVCDNYARCGPYGMCDISKSDVCSCLKGFQPKDPENWNYADNSGGCERITPFVCQNGDGFMKYGGVKLPDTTHSWVNQSMSLKECRASCLNNCSCTAYAISNVKGASSCTIWFGDLISLRKLLDEGQDLYVRMPASESDTNRPRKTKIIVIAVAAVSIVSGTFLAVYCIHKRRRKLKEKLRKDGMMGQNNEGQKEDLELPSFSLPTLTTATDNFSFNMKLGEGGFGSVYKGRLVDGQEIAVKRLSQSSRQGIAEFKNEVILIAKLQHRNLVKLLGYCIQGEERLLIYEYMPNKSLDFYIFDQNQGRLLDWSQRFHIICGIARGLLYLHQDSRLRIIHRDLKASNVLLDKEMNPKISDFGMARIFGGDQTEGVTKKVVGTYGYMAPEYAIDGQFSVKSDVFSFGVLLLETLSGKRSRGFYDRNHDLNLIGHAWRIWKEGRSLEMIDKCLSDSCTLSEVLRCVHVSLLCVQQLPEDRPTMSTVVLMLGGESALPQPKKPAFFLGKHPSSEAGSSSSKNQTSSTFGVRNETSSTNESSMTVLLPR